MKFFLNFFYLIIFFSSHLYPVDNYNIHFTNFDNNALLKNEIKGIVEELLFLITKFIKNKKVFDKNNLFSYTQTLQLAYQNIFDFKEEEINAFFNTVVQLLFELKSIAGYSQELLFDTSSLFDFLDSIQKNIAILGEFEIDLQLNWAQKIYKAAYQKISESNFFKNYYENNFSLISLFSVLTAADSFLYFSPELQKKSLIFEPLFAMKNIFTGKEVPEERKNKIFIEKYHYIKYLAPFVSFFVCKEIGLYVDDKGYFDNTKKFINTMHKYFMGSKVKKFMSNDILDEIIQYDADSKVSLKDPIFNFLREKKLLDWFDQIISNVELIYKKNKYNLDSGISRVLMITGDSGTGKTNLVRTFYNDIKEIAKKYGEDSCVEFYPLEPKHFHGPVLGRWRCPIDLLKELENKIEDIKYKKKFYIIHFDEFHLYFYNEYGSISQSRIADFLKFFSLVKETQKKYDCKGAFIVILSTNKEEFIPYEMYTNPSRISTIIRLPNPNYVEIIDIIKNYFLQKNISLEGIDISYIATLCIQYKLPTGSILQLLEDVYLASKSKNTILSNDIFSLYINKTLRGISYDFDYGYNNEFIASFLSYKEGFNFLLKNIIAEYTNNELVLDFVTIYPIKENRGQWSSANMHVKNDFSDIAKHSGTFFIEKNPLVVYNKKTLAKILCSMIGVLFNTIRKDGFYLKEYDYMYTDVYDILAEYYLYRDGFMHLFSHKKNMVRKINKNCGLFSGCDEISALEKTFINQKLSVVMPLIVQEIYKYLNDLNSAMLSQIDLVANLLMKEKLLSSVFSEVIEYQLKSLDKKNILNLLDRINMILESH